MPEKDQEGEPKQRTNRLAKKIAASLAGKASRQVTVKVTDGPNIPLLQHRLSRVSRRECQLLDRHVSSLAKRGFITSVARGLVCFGA